MKTRILRYLKHIFATIFILAIPLIMFGLWHGASLHYDDHPLMMTLDKDGPYVFYPTDSTLTVNYVRGNKKDGFYVEQTTHPTNSPVPTSCHFQIDSTNFDFELKSEFEIPKSTYTDTNPILAISDIEGSYKAFRDFLIHSKVIDKNLNWTFGKGHLVLVGDFVDRGWSVTQVLWFIYKLEQDAQKQGGMVHFIIGNHELKNMQGNHKSTAPKYRGMAYILGKQLHELYNSSSFIGKWMASKNSIELINGNLFVHGGIHPEVAKSKLCIQEINQVVRNNYDKGYYPKVQNTDEKLLNSTKKGICWYRGYFREDLSQEEVEKGLKKFNAKSVIVGHTPQSRVKKYYQGKVIGIDIRHPKDYKKNFPFQESEGLLIEGNKYYRVLATGKKKEI